MVTFLLLFTSRKSFQSVSFSLPRKQGGGVWGGAPAATLATQAPRPHLLHECLDLVLQLPGQMWASPVWSRGQEAETVDGAKLPFHLATRLKQPGRGERRA